MKKSIAFFTTILTTGGLDRQILSMGNFFVKHGYVIHIYSLLPQQKYQSLIKSSDNIIIHYPRDNTTTYILAGILESTPELFRITCNNFPRISIMKKKIKALINYRIREKFVMDKNFSQIYQEFKQDHEANSFQFLIGFSYQTIPYLSKISKEMHISSKYIEISSPKYRHDAEIDEFTVPSDFDTINDIIVPSKKIGEELLNYYSLSRHFSILPLFLEMPPSEYNTDFQDIPLTFGLAARFSPEKNQDLLIKIEHYIKHHTIRNNVKLVLAGSGPTEEKNRSLCKELGLDNDVIFLGQRENILDFINQIGVVVLLSDVESVSATLLESIYFGKPVIATDVGSTKDLIIDGFNGYIIQNKFDIAEIANKIITILYNKEKYREMSQNSRRIYLSSHSQAETKLSDFFGI